MGERMNSLEASERQMLRHLYEDCAPAMVRLTVQLQTGDLSNGAGFHIGNGLIITARHIIGSGSLNEITAESNAAPDILVERIHVPDDSSVDLAVLETNFSITHYLERTTFVNDPRRNAAKTDRIPLGYHLDDWIGDDLVLTQVLLMGYPRVPFWNRVGLVASAGQVNAVIDRYDAKHPHFIISATLRGGFSGGPAVGEYGFLLGMITQSLTEGYRDAELGYAAVLTVEPILALLAQRNLRSPDMDDEIWEIFTNPAYERPH